MILDMVHKQVVVEGLIREDELRASLDEANATINKLRAELAACRVVATSKAQELADAHATIDIAMDEEEPPPMTVVCAWCGSLKSGAGSEPISHGMCEACAKKEEVDR